MQEKPIQIYGSFIEDSAKIGQPVHYVLKVLHSKNKELFSPFKPFLFPRELKF